MNNLKLLQQFSSFGNAAYAMDLVLPLSEHAAMRLRETYFSHGAAAASGPNLCRLYLSTTLGAHSTHKLDVPRYEALMSAYPDFQVTQEVIANGMGETLCRIHLRAGHGGRDIDFVLGGDGGDGFAGDRFQSGMYAPHNSSRGRTIHRPSSLRYTNDSGLG